jgi:hypothetical protein
MRGGQWQTLYLARGLRERGESVRVLARGEFYAAAVAQRFEVSPAGVPGMWRWSRWADIVHAQDARSHTLAAVVSRCPLVASRRVAFPIGRDAASRWKYRRARRLIAISRHVATALGAAGVPQDRIAIVPDGVPAPESPVAAFSARPLQFLALPTGDPMKGDDLVQGAAALGGFGVTWTEHLVDDLRRARVFIYVSRSEGLGSAALLAMANGTAVIASNEGGLKEIVEHEQTGLLVENNPDAIAAAMSRLAADQDLAQSLAASGAERVRRHFSVDRMVAGTIEVYRSVLG